MIKIYLENGIVYETDVTIDRAYDKITKLIDDGIPFLCIESNGVKKIIKINMIEEITEVKTGLSNDELAYIRACEQLNSGQMIHPINVNITFDKGKELNVQQLADGIRKGFRLRELIQSSY